MRPLTLALAAAFAVGAFSSAASAQQRPRGADGVRPVNSTTFVSRDQNGRTRTKILVQKRSYLDGGTEVLPSDNVDSFRSSFIGQRPDAVLKNTVADQQQWAIDDPYFLASGRNPYPFSGN